MRTVDVYDGVVALWPWHERVALRHYAPRLSRVEDGVRARKLTVIIRGRKWPTRGVFVPAGMTLKRRILLEHFDVRVFESAQPAEVEDGSVFTSSGAPLPLYASWSEHKRRE